MSDDEIAPIRCNCQTINLDGDIEWMDNDEALVVMKRLQKWAAIQSSKEVQEGRGWMFAGYRFQNLMAALQLVISGHIR